MASFLTLYHQIESKLVKIKQVVEENKEENNTLKNNLAQALKRIEQLENEVNLLAEKNKIITITKTALYKEDKKQTEKKIDKLVRDIDHRIELLNRMQWKTETSQ
jgi:chaperonin cofactor prefoldin